MRLSWASRQTWRVRSEKRKLHRLLVNIESVYSHVHSPVSHEWASTGRKQLLCQTNICFHSSSSFYHFFYFLFICTVSLLFSIPLRLLCIRHCHFYEFVSVFSLNFTFFCFPPVCLNRTIRTECFRYLFSSMISSCSENHIWKPLVGFTHRTSIFLAFRWYDIYNMTSLMSKV